MLLVILFILVQTANWSGWNDYSMELPKCHDHKKGKENERKQVEKTLVPEEDICLYLCLSNIFFLTQQEFPQVGAALAAGCTCVLKPAEDTPLSGLLYEQYHIYIFADNKSHPIPYQLLPWHLWLRRQGYHLGSSTLLHQAGWSSQIASTDYTNFIFLASMRKIMGG